MKCIASIEKLPVLHKTFASIIRTGSKNATLLSDIMSIAEIKDRRIAYQVIEELITKHGYVIVANRHGKNKGYYYPANEHEFNQAIKTFENAITSMENRYKKLIKNYKQGA